MKHVNPYLNLLGQAEEAFEFYRSVFGGDIRTMLRYRDMNTGDARDGNLIAHISLPIGANTILMGSDVSGAQADEFRLGTNVEIYLAPDDLAEAKRLFDALATGGTVTMPLEATSWSESFGTCIDRYGVRWVVDYSSEAGSDPT